MCVRQVKRLKEGENVWWQWGKKENTWNSSQEIAGHSSPLKDAAWTLMLAWLPMDCCASSRRPMWKVATDICKTSQSWAIFSEVKSLSFSSYHSLSLPRGLLYRHVEVRGRGSRRQVEVGVVQAVVLHGLAGDLDRRFALAAYCKQGVIDASIGVILERTYGQAHRKFFRIFSKIPDWSQQSSPNRRRCRRSWHSANPLPRSARSLLRSLQRCWAAPSCWSGWMWGCSSSWSRPRWRCRCCSPCSCWDWRSGG